MIPKNPTHTALPKNPGPKKTNETLPLGIEDYNIEVMVKSVLSQHKGNKKWFEIYVNKWHLQKLKIVQGIFGKNFSWNEVICFGFHHKKTSNISLHKTNFDIESPDCKKIYFKPTHDALFAILKIGQTNSAEILIDLGLKILLKKLNSDA